MMQCIEKLMRREDLDHHLACVAAEALLHPATNPLQVAAFLALLRSKGEVSAELLALIQTLQAKMQVVITQHRVLDIVGTGGDGYNTVNISTGSALLAASCGVKVLKHGNRASTSHAGSADVLEALGINIHLTAAQVSACIDQVGIGFCYAPAFHPAFAVLKDLRKQLQVPTTLNLLGPLLNPAARVHLILGVADAKLLGTMADVLMQMQAYRSVIVHGMGLDEISCVGPIQVIEINQHEKKEFILEPQLLGLRPCSIADLRGGDAGTNAQLLLATFHGKAGAIADTLILNAAMALYIYGLHATIEEALLHARATLLSGAVVSLLNRWVECCNDYT